MPQLPSGTVTFVFSDIEDSTRLTLQLGDEAYADVLTIHRRLVRATFAEHGGQEIDTQGDAFFYSFTRARAALAAAVAIQRAHAEQEWPPDAALRIRLGLHTGEPVVGDEGYTGLDVVRASRIASIGRGGQVLLSETTRAIVARDLPFGVELRPLGEHTLKGLERPEPIYELVIVDLPAAEATTEAAAEAAAEPIAESAGALARTTPQPPGRPGDFVDAALVREGAPSWARAAARRFLPASLPGSAESHRLIEERVMGEIERSFQEREQARQRRRLGRQRGQTPDGRSAVTPGAPRDAASVADEIAKLRALREAGALTDEQYERAVERVIAKD